MMSYLNPSRAQATERTKAHSEMGTRNLEDFMNFSDQFVKEYLEATKMEPWVARERIREIRYRKGMRDYKYRRIPLDQRPKFDDTQANQEIELLERVIKLHEEMYPEQHQETDFIDDESDDDDI